MRIAPGTVLLVATTNAGKWKELRLLLAELPLDVRALSDRAEWASIRAPEETGSTFEENARLKARYYAAATGMLTVADDSGLAIDALDGAPGLHSARYPGATYDERFRSLFAALDARGATTPAQRTARFVCAVTLAHPDGVLFESRGTVEGLIAPEPRGTGGFGYDPIFYYPPYGRTLAEIDAEEKARVSHRGVALRALRAFLDEQVA